MDRLWQTCRRGAWFGAKASATILGSVFLAIYGGSAAWWLYIRLTQGSMAATMLIESEGGAKSLEREFWMAAGRVVWLTACCTVMSAIIFVACSVLSGPPDLSGKRTNRHPLDQEGAT